MTCVCVCANVYTYACTMLACVKLLNEVNYTLRKVQLVFFSQPDESLQTEPTCVMSISIRESKSSALNKHPLGPFQLLSPPKVTTILTSYARDSLCLRLYFVKMVPHLYLASFLH